MLRIKSSCSSIEVVRVDIGKESESSALGSLGTGRVESQGFVDEFNTQV